MFPPNRGSPLPWIFPRARLTWGLALSLSEAILVSVPRSVPSSRRSGALGAAGAVSRAGQGAAAGTDPLFMCRHPARPGMAWGRHRGWQPVLHCPASPGTSGPLRLSMTLVCAGRRCHLCEPSWAHELTWAGSWGCSQGTKRFLAWAEQPQQPSQSLPSLPPSVPSTQQNLQMKNQKAKKNPPSCAC